MILYEYMKGISLREQRLIQENKAMENVLVEVLGQRDKARAEILSMERKMIMNYGSKKHVDYKLSLFIDNLVHERNHLEEMVVNQQQIIHRLSTPVAE